MIRIPRTTPAPARLVQNGSRQTNQDCTAYDQSPQDYNSGTKSFPDRDYYRTEEVKGALVEMHRGKCCYCEKRLESRELQVEHFRPKGAVRQLPGDANERPGYFWLAYSWIISSWPARPATGRRVQHSHWKTPGNVLVLATTKWCAKWRNS